MGETIHQSFENDPEKVGREIAKQMHSIWPVWLDNDFVFVDFDTVIHLDEETISLYVNPN